MLILEKIESFLFLRCTYRISIDGLRFVAEVASSWAVQVEASLVDRRGPSWAVQEVASLAGLRVPSSVDLEGPSSWAILVSGTFQVEAFCCHTKPEG